MQHILKRDKNISLQFLFLENVIVSGIPLNRSLPVCIAANLR